MPAYGTATPQTQTAGWPQVVWNDEAVAASGKSLAIGMRRNSNMPNCLSVEVIFASSPGTFGVDLETADTDQDKYYTVKASLSTVNAQFAGRIEAANVVAKFARLKMTSITNASVHVTARIF